LQAYRQYITDDYENSICFHLLGFDVLLDNKCRPFLLEVNHSPSLSTDSPLDEHVKKTLVFDTVSMLGLTPQRKAIYKANSQKFAELRAKSGKHIRLP
jgi:tubulin polyglutamylase TTLL6/13